MNATPHKNANHLIWIDLEMTGLDTQNDRIIEIATVITDAELNVLAHGPELAINVPDDTLNKMDQWNTSHHERSGLTARVRASKNDLASAEAETLMFLRRWVPERASPMCGNSICQDRRFLAREMPTLEAYFHYRNLDVSSLKELHRRWYPNVPGFEKRPAHLALSDILDSIAELKYYREKIMR